MIFVLVNAAGILYVRYTKNLYESSSELKLDVKDDATALGIKSVVEDPNVNLLSGEIEIIQSKLFLTQVLHAAPIGVSYYSMGRVLNEELFTSTPFYVRHKVKASSLYNQPIFVEEKSLNEFILRIGKDGKEFKGRYNQTLSLPEADLTIVRNNKFIKGDEVGYFFIINSDDALLKYMVQNLTAEPLNFNANTIRIAFKDYNAHKAQKILEKIDTLYLKYSNDQKNLANFQKIEWLSNELAMLEKKMEGIEDYFETFTLQNKSNNLDIC
jgi:uncharacterized protein involved in exopolysaccharide biosynthesis